MSVPSIHEAGYAAEPWLFAESEEAAVQAFRASAAAKLSSHEVIVDLFCGAGGWFGRGAEGEAAKIGLKVDAAVDHSALAIAWHEKNHPECVHLTGDAWKTRPAEVLDAISARRGFRARMGWLVASAACTTHSRARGSAPISKRVHMLGWCCARYIKDGMPRGFVLENVVEWQDWGPVSRATGKPCPRRKGQHYRALLAYLRGLGYSVESRIIEAADHGTHCRRRRLFVQGRRDGAPICWPEVKYGKQHRADGSGQAGDQARARSGSARRGFSASHDGHGVAFATHEGGSASHIDQRAGGTGRAAEVVAKGTPQGAADSFPREDRAVGEAPRKQVHQPAALAVRDHRLTHRPAHEVIDWSDLGHSIFLTPAEAKVAGCKRPLADKSLERIARGVIRHVLEDLNPFVMRVTQKGVSGQVWGVDRPMPTQTTRQDLAVCTPVIASLAHGNNGTNGRRWRDVREPLGGIHAGGNNWGAATPLFQVFRGNAAATRADGPLSTITAGSGPGRGAGAGHAMAMIAPLLAQVGYGEREGQRARTADLRGPLGTCVAGGVKQAIVAPVMATLRNHDTGSRADRPFDTISAGGNHAALIAPLLMQYYGRGETTRPDWVLPTVVTKDRHALVCVVIDGLTWVMVDILFRMLRPDELAAAMGFARSYLFPSQKRQAVQLIGNAVAPPVGEALLMAALPGGRAA